MTDQNNNNNKSDEHSQEEQKQVKSLGLFSSLKQEPDDEAQPLVDQQQPIKDDQSRLSQDQERLIQKEKLKDKGIKRYRMNGFQTWFAIFKGYTTLNIFCLPIGFKEGGWLFSPLVLMLACFVESMSAIKLSQAAHSVKIYNYPDLIEYCFGKIARQILQIFIAILHFGFTLSQMTYFCKALKILTLNIFHQDVEMWIFMMVTVLIFAPLVWIRTVETFKIGYVFGSIVIFVMIIVVITFSSMVIHDNNNQAGIDWEPFNNQNFITMVALSFYQYEGIGTILPIMEASDCKEYMTTLIATALATLCFIHITFSELIYYAYGNDITEPIIIFQIPQDNPIVITSEILFLGNVIFSYPLTIYVTNQIIESIVFSRMRYSELRKWLKNLSRTIVIFLAVFIGVTYYHYMPKILGLIGVILGAIVVIITPALIHNKLVANSCCAKAFNYIFMVYAVCCAFFITFFVIYTWNRQEAHKGHHH